MLYKNLLIALGGEQRQLHITAIPPVVTEERVATECREMLRWSPALTDRKPKGHLQRSAIVCLCIKFFSYVPHEFTASLKLAGLNAENISSCAVWRTKAVYLSGKWEAAGLDFSSILY